MLSNKGQTLKGENDNIIAIFKWSWRCKKCCLLPEDRANKTIEQVFNLYTWFIRAENWAT